MASEKKEDGLGDLTSYKDDDLSTLAGIAEQAERYDDMCDFMRTLVTRQFSAGKTLPMEKRNLLSVAYKNVVGSKRQSWRFLSASTFENLKDEVQKGYKSLVEKELEAVCNEVINLLNVDDGPVKKAQKNLKDVADEDAEDVVFYLKMMGDYYRYLAEFKEDDKTKENTENFYKDAMEVAKAKLAETQPTRLGLALNFSVAYYEILKKKEEACKLAKEAFDAAIEKLDTLNDASYKDSTLIMQLLRDNLTLWTADSAEDGGDKDEDGDVNA